MNSRNNVRLLEGTVSKNKEWMKAKYPFPVLHVVYGKLFCPMKATPTTPRQSSKSRIEKTIFVLQDWKNVDQKLRCVYYSVDRSLPIFRPGAIIRAVGVGQTDGSLLVNCYENCQGVPNISRLIFFSQRGIRLGLNQKKIEEESNKENES